MIQYEQQPLNTHAGLMEEQLSQIPVYSREWTNYNPSDPGITILENLTAFSLLSARALGETTDAVKTALLRLAGCERKKETAAFVWLEPEPGKRGCYLPAGQRFRTGDICFETLEAVETFPGRLTGIFLKNGAEFSDLSHLLDREITTGAEVFTGKPKPGMELYLVMDEAPPPEEKLCFFVSVKEKEKRNAFEPGDAALFSKIRWQLYTSGGFTDLDAADESCGFLTDGVIVLRTGRETAAWLEDGPVSGFVLRAGLLAADYDVPPDVRAISGFLFPARQQETLAAVHRFAGSREMLLWDRMAEEGYARVFIRRKGEDFYRLYGEESTPAGQNSGPAIKRLESGRYVFRLDGEEEGRCEELRISVCTEKIMRSGHIGRLGGWEEQEFSLPVTHVLADSFLLLARRKNGPDTAYYFIPPKATEEGALSYEINGEEGRLFVRDPGRFAGAQLYVAACRVTCAGRGNVLPGNLFTAEGLPEDIRFQNPAGGQGGAFAESLQEAEKRLADSLACPQTAVTAADFERIASACPGLCIDKVRAWAGEGENEVMIAVKPATPEPFPQLSDVYRKKLIRRLEMRRPLSMKVSVRPPVYASVYVYGCVYVKKHYENSEEMIRDAVKKQTDYRTGPKGFGESLKLESLYTAIASLPCVARVKSLDIRPGNTVKVRREGGDILPDENCLLYPGDIRLTIVETDGYS